MTTQSFQRSSTSENWFTTRMLLWRKCRAKSYILFLQVPVLSLLGPVTYLYWVLGRRRTLMLHHDHLKLCDDWAIPAWALRNRHVLLSTMLDDSLEPSQSIEAQLEPQDNEQSIVTFAPQTLSAKAIGGRGDLRSSGSEPVGAVI